MRKVTAFDGIGHSPALFQVFCQYYTMHFMGAMLMMGINIGVFKFAVPAVFNLLYIRLRTSCIKPLVFEGLPLLCNLLNSLIFC